MSIIRKGNKHSNCVVLDKEGIENPNLSWKAKGLLAYLVSRPDNWHVYIEQLANVGTDGRDSTSAGIKELIEAGYIVRQRLTENGKFAGYDYTVYEVAIKAESVNGETVNGKSVNGETVNGKTTANKEVSKQSIKETNNKEKEENFSFSEKSSPIPAVQEARANIVPHVSQDFALIPFPSHIDTPEIKKLWGVFLQAMKGEGKPIKTRERAEALITLLGDLSNHESHAIESIKYSILKGYPTFYDKRENATNATKQSGRSNTGAASIPPARRGSHADEKQSLLNAIAERYGRKQD